MRDGIGKDESGNGNDWDTTELTNTVKGLESSEAVSVNGSVITFADDTDLDEFNVGDILSGGGKAFTVTTYTGTGSSGAFVETGIDNTSGKSMIWLKSRGQSYDHALYDSERGWRVLTPNETYAQGVSSNITGLTTTGFNTDSSNILNQSGQNYVAWNFKAAAGFFDIVTWSGDGNYPRQIPHSLGSAPGCIILKTTNNTQGWFTYHKGAGVTQYGYLDTNNLFQVGNGTDLWVPTESSFSPAAFYGGNSGGDDYVAYLFADTPGKIKCGTYENLTSGDSVDVGFKPGWVLLKNADQNTNWMVFDTKRYNGYNPPLRTDTNEAEEAANYLELTDTGIQFNALNSITVGNYKFIYVAIAEDVLSGGLVEAVNAEDNQLQ